MEKQKYLVLGSSGFIGQNLCEYLKTQDCDVVEYDLRHKDDEDLRIYDNPNLIDTIANCDFVFFLAFDVGGSKFLSQCDKDFRFLSNNIKIIINTFEALSKLEKKFIFISSYLVKNVNHSYGLLKNIGEHFTCSLNGLVVRLYNIYGNEDVSIRSHVIPDLINQGKNFDTIKLNTNGEEKRQFLYIEDCCQGLYTISQNYDTILKENNIIDLTSFAWVSIKDVAEIISKMLGCQLEVSTKQADYCSEPVPQKAILKYWNPTTTLEVGINKIIKENK